jgi:tetratricopeptide (TPR) repeat protein
MGAAMSAKHALDADELFQFALRAIGKGEHEQAIGHLKQAHQLEPGNGKILYLLAAEHAEIGLFDRAAQEMEEALKLEPDMPAARFQLGLLHITSGRVDQARQAWQPLDALGDGHYFTLFRDGLLALTVDQWDVAITKLRAGIQANKENMPLNADMQRVLDDIQRRAGTPPDQPEADDDKVVTHHAFLSAYRDRESDND